MLIFVIALSIYYGYVNNLSLEEKGLVDELLADAKTMSSSLVSAGYPADWTNATVERIGITDGNYRVNEAKLEQFSDMPYRDSRRLFGIRFDYFVFFEDKGRCLIEVDGSYGVGHPDVEIEDDENGPSGCTIGTERLVVGMDEISPEKLVKIVRLVIYNSEIIRMVVYVWQ